MSTCVNSSSDTSPLRDRRFNAASEGLETLGVMVSTGGVSEGKTPAIRLRHKP